MPISSTSNNTTSLMTSLNEIRVSGWFRGIAAPLLAGILHDNEQPASSRVYDALLLAYQLGENVDDVNIMFGKLCAKPYSGDALAPDSYIPPRAAAKYYSVNHDRAALRYVVTYLAEQIKALNGKRKIPALTLMQYGEMIALCRFAFNETKKPQLMALAERWMKIGFDYSSLFNAFAQTDPMRRVMPPEQTARILSDILKISDKTETDDTGYGAASEIDIYTLKALANKGDIAAIGLRACAYRGAISGMKKDTDAAESGYSKLMKHHGTAITFTSDMHLAGRDPSRLVWINAACETIRSLLDICRLNPMNGASRDLLDSAERIFVNLLPCAISDGYVEEAQRVNQLSCIFDKRAAYSLSGSAVLYKKISAQPEIAAIIAGTLSHIASNAWHVTQDSLTLNYPIASIDAKFNGKSFAAKLETDYPFGGNTKITINVETPLKITLYVRIPGFASKTRIIKINGELFETERNGYAVLTREWNNGDIIESSFPVTPRLEKVDASSAAYYAGSNLLALPLSETQTVSPDGTAVELTSDETWSYGIIEGGTPAALGENTYEASVFAFPAWRAQHAIAAQPPHVSRIFTPTEKIKLVPYSTTRLRIAQFPFIETREPRETGKRAPGLVPELDKAHIE